MNKINILAYTEQRQFVRTWTLQCQVGWISFGWWTILDIQETVEREKPSSLAVFENNQIGEHGT
jgi:hypothetical protein